MNQYEFWDRADRAQQLIVNRAEDCMRALRGAPLETVCKILIQYRYFGLHFIDDLALLLSKMPAGSLRSFLGQVLAEELGDGEHTRSHPYLYDAFLESLGVPAITRSESWILQSNRLILRDISERLRERSVGFGIGLRGMGGECLCHTYLIKLWTYFTANAQIQARSALIDWRFWEIHVGPIDAAHVEHTRARISEFVCANPEQAHELSAGYECSLAVWDQFWSNAFGAYPVA